MGASYLTAREGSGFAGVVDDWAVLAMPDPQARRLLEDSASLGAVLDKGAG